MRRGLVAVVGGIILWTCGVEELHVSVANLVVWRKVEKYSCQYNCTQKEEQSNQSFLLPYITFLPEFHQVLKVSSLSENVITLPSSHHLCTFHHFANSKFKKLEDQRSKRSTNKGQKIKDQKVQSSQKDQEIRSPQFKDQSKVRSSKVN